MLRTLGLWALGIVGAVLLLSTFQFSAEMMAEFEANGITTEMARYLSLANSAVMLLIAVLIGRFAAGKLNLVSLIARPASAQDKVPVTLFLYLVLGVILGIATGYIDAWAIRQNEALAAFFADNAEELSALGSNLNLAQRIFYGGITEEILMRWGFMGLIALLFFWITRSRAVALTLGVIGAAVIFGIGHLPVLMQTVGEIPNEMLIRVIAFNGVLGVFYGIAYARHYLEAAMAAHIGTHLGITALMIAGLV